MRLITRIALVVIISLLLYGSQAMAAPVVGTAISVQGNVTLKHIEKEEPDVMKARSRVYEKDIIETMANSKTKILFQDESLMNVSENSRIEVVQQAKDEETKTNKSVYQLVTGKIRVLAGKISGEKAEYEVKTPTALAAVRGTQFFVWVESPTATKIFVVKGEVEVENIEIPGVKVSVSENFWTLVEAGAVPVEPSLVSDEDLNKLYRDTTISADNTISPRARNAFRASAAEGEGTEGDTGGEDEGGGTEEVDIAGEGTGDTGGGTGTDVPDNEIDANNPTDDNGNDILNQVNESNQGNSGQGNDPKETTITEPNEGERGGKAASDDDVNPPEPKGKIIIKF